VKSPTELAELLQSQGLKVTPQRECIFGIVHGVTTHPTAEAVYDEARRRMPTISLKTVYQTLNDLARMGEVQLLDVGTGAGRFDPNVEPHHHLVCNSCGTVRDVYVDLSAVGVPDEDLDGFVVESADVVFRGRCARCTGVPAGGPGDRSTASSRDRRASDHRPPTQGASHA